MINRGESIWRVLEWLGAGYSLIGKSLAFDGDAIQDCFKSMFGGGGENNVESSGWEIEDIDDVGSVGGALGNEAIAEIFERLDSFLHARDEFQRYKHVMSMSSQMYNSVIAQIISDIISQAPPNTPNDFQLVTSNSAPTSKEISEESIGAVFGRFLAGNTQPTHPSQFAKVFVYFEGGITHTEIGICRGILERAGGVEVLFGGSEICDGVRGIFDDLIINAS